MSASDAAVVSTNGGADANTDAHNFDEHFLEETLCGFLTNDSGDIYEIFYDGAMSCFDKSISSLGLGDAAVHLVALPSNETKSYALAVRAVHFTKLMLNISIHESMKQKEKWDALQKASMLLQESAAEPNALALACVFAVLALCDSESSRASASAISSTLSRNKPLRHEGYAISRSILRSVLIHAAYSSAVKLHIVAHFAHAFHIVGDEHAQESSKAIQRCFDHCSRSITVNGDSSDVPIELQKEQISGALAFAVQVPPWPFLDPVSIVEAAIPLDYWHGAELICKSAAKYKESGGTLWPQATKAVHTLIDASIEARLYRRADNLATGLYEFGGKSRFVEARFLHACETISKVLKKRQLPIIERQVDRIDKAVDKITKEKCNELTESMSDFLSTGSGSVKEEIRTFALSRLEEAGESDAIHRLAELWGREYEYDEEAIQAAATARRKMYLQWNDVLSGQPPDVTSSPAELIRLFEVMRNVEGHKPRYGFDVEWEEDSAGAALLQLSSLKMALLIDIPALSMTEDGVAALEQTIGQLFNSPSSVVVGFSCRQDLSRLRTSSTVRDYHWLSGTKAVVDVQQLVARDEPKLQRFGLSRVCEHYLGKPLDKSEQCSMWNGRPLSERQRVYAALDAWACVKIYDIISP